MGRLSFVIGSALLLTGGLNLLFAQHSGGHASSGHAASGHGGSYFSGQSHAAPPSTTYSTLSNHYPLPGQAVYPTPLGLQRQFSGYTGINPGVLNNGNRGRYRGGRPYGYGYGTPYLYPYYLSTFDDSDTPFAYDNYSGEDQAAQNSMVTANLLGEQIAQLSAEVDALRNERTPGYEGEPDRRPPYYAPPAAADDDTAPSPPITLILNDGRKVEMTNYAVMGQNIWDFSSHPTKRIALANINLAASKKATEESGAEFPDLH